MQTRPGNGSARPGFPLRPGIMFIPCSSTITPVRGERPDLDHGIVSFGFPGSWVRPDLRWLLYM